MTGSAQALPRRLGEAAKKAGGTFLPAFCFMECPMRKASTDKAAGWVNGLALIAVHELSALRAHFSATGIRYRVARRARDAGELLRDQFDLTAETLNRLSRDQRLRRELWRSVIRGTP